MSDLPPDKHATPPPIPPRRVLPYLPPTKEIVRAFGSFAGNMAVGTAAFVVSCVAGAVLAVRSHSVDPWIGFIPAGITLVIGVAAACFSRYRGVLSGMLLVIGLAGLLMAGVVLLIIGICGQR